MQGFLDCPACFEQLVTKPETVRMCQSLSYDMDLTVSALVNQYFQDFHRGGHRQHREGGRSR